MSVPLPGQQALTGERNTGTLIVGVWTPGTASALSLVGSIQQFTLEQMQMLPEGERTREQRKIFTRDTLRPASPDGTTPGDRVNYEGRVWEVHASGYWDVKTGGPANHNEYRLVAIAEDEK